MFGVPRYAWNMARNTAKNKYGGKVWRAIEPIAIIRAVVWLSAGKIASMVHETVQ